MGPSKCPYKWVTGVKKTYLYGLITPLITAEGAHLLWEKGKLEGNLEFSVLKLWGGDWLPVCGNARADGRKTSRRF